jgi:hypothetical protein
VIRYVTYIPPPDTIKFEASYSFCGFDTVILMYSKLAAAEDEPSDLENLPELFEFQLGLSTPLTSLK